jgi:hypothetical protein
MESCQPINRLKDKEEEGGGGGGGGGEYAMQCNSMRRLEKVYRLKKLLKRHDQIVVWLPQEG